ncbi:MAG: DUF5009 domain-containing protein [Gemmatimonadota bacterium]
MPATETRDAKARDAGAEGRRPSGRLVSLDAFRGLTIAAMILVNNPGSWNHVYPPLLHAEWNGWTPTDLIFPFFLFIVGVAMPFSFARRLERGGSRISLLRHSVRRALVIAGLGLFMAGFPRFDLGGIRIPGVLQRIGLVYLVAAPAYLFLSVRVRAALTATLLLGYWALLMWVPWAGHTPGDLTPDGNLGAFIDRALLGGHLWSQSRTWDPEGLLSTLPAVASALLGVFTGEYLRSQRDRTYAVRVLSAAGVTLTLIGLLWGRTFPINKSLWTSSYVVFTAGAALLALAGCMLAIDVAGWRAWARPFEVYGRNAIAVFVGSGLLAKMLIRTQIAAPDGGQRSLYAWLYETLFLPWASPVNASLAFAVSTVVLWWAVLRWMDHRRIYLKV